MKSAVAVVIVAGALLSTPGSGFAMGSGSDSSSQPKPTCEEGQTYSETEKKCVPEASAPKSDQSLIERGWALAYARRYKDAADLFQLVRNTDNPEVLNGLGYTHRKQGMVEQGITYYKQALAIDPDYVLAREYLGEGYIAEGRTDLARQQLDEIEKRCGTGCKEYRRLARAIATGGANDW
jgi:tetratricopeptide (TPR) repeat protein